MQGTDLSVHYRGLYYAPLVLAIRPGWAKNSVKIGVYSYSRMRGRISAGITDLAVFTMITMNSMSCHPALRLWSWWRNVRSAQSRFSYICQNDFIVTLKDLCNHCFADPTNSRIWTKRVLKLSSELFGSVRIHLLCNTPWLSEVFVSFSLPGIFKYCWEM